MKGTNFRLLSQILRGSWLMDRQSAMNNMPLIVKLLDGVPNAGFFSDEEDDDEVFAFIIPPTSNGFEKFEVKSYSDFNDAQEGSVALIFISGTLMKEDYCGEPGTATLCEYIKAADQNPNIISAVHIYDSPGGTVDGTETFSATIKNTIKPVVGFVNGLAASAAFWGISGSNHIMLNGETAQVGSLGTMISITDFSSWFQYEGIKEHNVTADKSKDKNSWYYQLLEGNYKPVKEELLNPLNEVFLNTVKVNRPNISEEALTGKMFLGSTAVSKSLADSIGTLEMAIEKARELAEAQSPHDTNSQLNNSNINENKMFNSKLDKAVELLTAKVKSGEEVLLEDIQPIDDALSAKGLDGFVIATKVGVTTLHDNNLILNSQVESLTKEKETLTQQNSENSKTVETLTAELATAKADVDKYKGLAEKYGYKPGANHSTPLKGKDNLDDNEPEFVSEADLEVKEARRKAGFKE